MAMVKTTKRAVKGVVKGAKKVYKGTTKYAGRTVNRVMRPVTRVTKRVVRRIPLIGGPLSVVAGLPRKVTRAGTKVVIALPRAAGRVANTGRQVIMRSLSDPLLATGLAPTGRPVRHIKKAKK